MWGTGNAIRDYLYIDDFINLCTNLINLRQPPKGISIYNAGTGIGHSINDLIDVVSQVTGGEITITKHPARSVDVDKVILDPTRATTDLFWSPQCDLKRGIESTWQWYCANL